MQEQTSDNLRPGRMPSGPPGKIRPDEDRSLARPPASSRMNRKQAFLTKYYEPVRGSVKEDARTGHKIYRLKGYTTVDKINRKFQQERNQRSLRNILTFLMIVILLVILIAIYNPFTNIDELKKISGEDSLYKKQQESATTERFLEFP